MTSENANPSQDKMDQPLPAWVILLMPVYISIVVGVFLFPIAGDWRWLEAWIFVLSFSISMTIGYAIINHQNPRVLRNRARMKKEGLTAATRQSAGSDRWIMPVLSLAFFGALVLPAFSRRFGWEVFPLWVSRTGIVVFQAGLWTVFSAMLENAYASKLLDINQGQTLIDSGPYARVRHPLYSGAILMMIAMPIALGSTISLVPGVIAASMLVIRIPFEEEMLLKGMADYADYQQRVKYRLIPGIY